MVTSSTPSFVSGVLTVPVSVCVCVCMCVCRLFFDEMTCFCSMANT